LRTTDSSDDPIAKALAKPPHEDGLHLGQQVDRVFNDSLDVVVMGKSVSKNVSAKSALKKQSVH